MRKAILLVILFLGITTASGLFAEAAAQKKWSSRKKGAVIGAAAGAGTGYVTGRHKDKKKGRLRKG